MNVDRLYRNLLNKLINANIDLDAYLQLRQSEGLYVSQRK
ncbi:Biofilm regulator bssR [Raoultella ornithinolytica]|nr:Biofilm regulator bssR [Raoultella ornithinolytica]